MIGHQETTTDGKLLFHPWSCEFCQLDSAGNHVFNCPYETGIYPDYDGKTTYQKKPSFSMTTPTEMTEGSG